ncbi:hypothetical protein DYB32_001274 [Aphanomyces invadans]|uniref:Uncharacterized protein n=1 Tax=Aphanomyces invadans TaxID=157072 RepID=A0A3R6ZVU0_9STRA|nr:hypothetical protein DYB32_001274 [Aphanomyces invadans]
MKFTSAVAVVHASSSFDRAAGIVHLPSIDRGAEARASLNHTRPACLDEPTIVYSNGSNSTYECWRRQFPSFNVDMPNNQMDNCHAANVCFYIGNDIHTSATLPQSYFLGAENSRTVTFPWYQGRWPVWKRVDMEFGNVGLYYYTDGTCLDAYWQRDELKVHQWTCEFGNRNQWWRYSLHNSLQLFEHAVHTGWCLQTNGIGDNVQMIRCNWGIQEQQRRLYW